MIISKPATFRQALLAATIAVLPVVLAAQTPAHAQVVANVSIQVAPPLLPVYVQPPMPDVGYVWTPGYWAYGQVGYYWVPGTWIQPPTVGVLWTPPYWDWVAGAYLFHAGYWGPHVGFYGGVNYGYGYGGNGYDGGHWNGNDFAYNQAANNFGSVHVANTYRQPLAVANRGNVSFAGRTNGIRAEPTAEQRSAESERHTPPTAEQSRHFAIAATNPALAANHNNGHPVVAATSRPAEVIRAGTARPLAVGAARPTAAAHPAERAVAPTAAARPVERPALPTAAARPSEPAMAPAAAARPGERPAAPAAHAVAAAPPHQVVAQAAARQTAPTPHSAAAPHPAAAPHADPPHAGPPEEKK